MKHITLVVSAGKKTIATNYPSMASAIRACHAFGLSVSKNVEHDAYCTCTKRQVYDYTGRNIATIYKFHHEEK